jgi:selenocysteine lyase/cysteine desulfurase
VNAQVIKPSASSVSFENARDRFEIPSDVTYLNCANMAPQLKSVTEAGLEAVRAKSSPWKLSAAEWFSGAEILRTLAGQLLDVDSEGIALVPAVSYGIAVAAANLPLSANQAVVLLDQEFPSNVYAWRELARKTGARIVTVRRSEETSWTEALERGVDKNTAIVAVPQCHWTDGSKIDLERVAQRARKVGAALVIDASQSLGACPLDLGRVQPDFLVAVGYKWLLGPYGLGYLYVAPKWRSSGVALEQSWLTRAGSEDFTRLVEYTDEYRPGARRFDMGEFPQFALGPMAIAALRQVLAWGVTHIHTALSTLTAEIAQRTREEGYSALTPDQRCGHMIGIRHPGGIPSELAARLNEAKIFVSIRGDSIRIAPHLYNDRNDIDRFFEVVRTTRVRGRSERAIH